MSDASLTPRHPQLVNSRSVFMIPQHDARFNVCVSAWVCDWRVWALCVCLRARVCVYERSTSYQCKSRGWKWAFSTILKICFTDGPTDQRTDRPANTLIHTHHHHRAYHPCYLPFHHHHHRMSAQKIWKKWLFFCLTETYAKFLFCIENTKMKKTKT